MVGQCHKNGLRLWAFADLRRAGSSSCVVRRTSCRHPSGRPGSVPPPLRPGFSGWRATNTCEIVARESEAEDGALFFGVAPRAARATLEQGAPPPVTPPGGYGARTALLSPLERC